MNGADIAAKPTEIAAAIAEMTVLVLNAVYNETSAIASTDHRATRSRSRSDGSFITRGNKLTEITVPQPNRMLSEVAVGGRDAGGNGYVVSPDLADTDPDFSYTDWVTTPGADLDIRAVTFSTRGLIVLDGNVLREFGPPRFDPPGVPIESTEKSRKRIAVATFTIHVKSSAPTAKMPMETRNSIKLGS